MRADPLVTLAETGASVAPNPLPDLVWHPQDDDAPDGEVYAEISMAFGPQIILAAIPWQTDPARWWCEVCVGVDQAQICRAGDEPPGYPDRARAQAVAVWLLRGWLSSVVAAVGGAGNDAGGVR